MLDHQSIDVLALVPDFELDGNDDLKILPIETAELLDAIDNRTPVDVDLEVGLVAVALVVACHESSEAGRTVSVAKVLNGSLAVYQNVETGSYVSRFETGMVKTSLNR